MAMSSIHSEPAPRIRTHPWSTTRAPELDAIAPSIDAAVTCNRKSTFLLAVSSAGTTLTSTGALAKSAFNRGQAGESTLRSSSADRVGVMIRCCHRRRWIGCYMPSGMRCPARANGLGRSKRTLRDPVPAAATTYGVWTGSEGRRQSARSGSCSAKRSSKAGQPCVATKAASAG